MAERRFSATASLRVERRAADDGTANASIVGHASVFNEWTTLYEGRYWTWREIVRPGAFARAIRDKHDVRSLLNHDPSYLLGRTTAGTLLLAEDDTGLATVTFPADTPTNRDRVLIPIDRRELTGMSFAFALPRRVERTVTEMPDGTVTIETPHERTTLRYENDRLIEEREILDLDLYDVSPVTYPAYEGTDVALRSRPNLEALIEERDRPHRRAAPRREELRSWLGSSAVAGGARIR
jgi:uncharacterized protein